ncbi:MAG: tetratricopeptide repeat protein [Proteobacteria bacterium]|nr:tetratricopeptide repeat protein [Pseudomonadota bacterium]
MNWFKRLFSSPKEEFAPDKPAHGNTHKESEPKEKSIRTAFPPAASRPPAPPPPGGSGDNASRERVIRVFVSSTFRDMIEDRNELMSHVWPALRRNCRGRAVEFVEVDLRWGVTEEQSQRKETLRHCLAEIRRCRPYFIGLLGERYGWVPGPEAYSPALLEEERWIEGELGKRSVTELEILHGVLNDPDMAHRSFFYFRDSAYAQARGGDYLSGSATDTYRQKALKQRIKDVCRDKMIPLRNYRDPRDLAFLVLADLSRVIDTEFPPDQVSDIWTREDREHEAYAKSRRTEFYVGRDTYVDQLDTYAEKGADGGGLLVIGESGGGKSALLANWVARWRNDHPNDFVFQHYIGSSPVSASHLDLMRRLMVAIIRWSDSQDSREEEEIPAKAKEIVKVFPDYLNRLALKVKEKGVHAVIVFDALNQLEERKRGRLLAWLPYRLSGELRLIVSTLSGDTLDALESRTWPTLRVEPLTDPERIELITQYLAHFSQTLSEASVYKIASVPAASSPLYLKTLLDDLRVTGAHERLDEQIADYLQAQDIPTLLVKIFNRYERDYERDRPQLVRDALSLLWAARRGLTEPELLEVLKLDGQKSLPAALWSPVRYALEDGLVDRDGVLAFAHEHLRMAVEKRYVPDDSTAKVLRFRLAKSLFGRYGEDLQADEVHWLSRLVDEVPWLLRQAEARDDLRALLPNIGWFFVISQRDFEELLGYWVWLGEERIMGKAYLETFEAWLKEPGQVDEEKIAYTANRMAVFLFHASLYNEAELLMRRALLIDEQHFGRNHPTVARDLSDLASLLMTTNRFADAESLMRRALLIFESNLGREHPHVATQLNNLATVLLLSNRFADAESLMRRALLIDEQHFGRNHPTVARDLNTLSLLLKATNRLTEAEPLYRRALMINEQSLGKDHPDVSTNLNNLANLLYTARRLTEAEPLYRRALVIAEKSLGKDHPDVAICLNNLSNVLLDTNRLTEAEPLSRRGIEIIHQLTRTTGHLHPNTQTGITNYRLILEAMGRSPAQILSTLRKLAPEFFRK